MMPQRSNLTVTAKPDESIPTEFRDSGFAMEFRLSTDEFWFVLKALRVSEALVGFMRRIQKQCSDPSCEVSDEIRNICESVRDYATGAIVPSVKLFESGTERMFPKVKVA